jgi:hypothetical protein
MFRKTTITITLAAATFVAIGSTSAPAEAFSPFEDWDCIVEPVHCIIDEATPDRERGPVEDDTTLDTSVVIDAISPDLGGIWFPEIDEPSIDVGGVVTDTGPGVVLAPALPDDVIDAITGPVVELPAVELPPLMAPADDDTDTPVEPAAPVAPETREPRDTPDTGRTTSTTLASPRVRAPEAAASDAAPATTVAVQDEPTDDQADETFEEQVEAAGVTETSSAFNPTMAALMGALGALVLLAVVFAAFRAGRRNN